VVKSRAPEDPAIWAVSDSNAAFGAARAKQFVGAIPTLAETKVAEANKAFQILSE
jgi:hypothetical protein